MRCANDDGGRIEGRRVKSGRAQVNAPADILIQMTSISAGRYEVTSRPTSCSRTAGLVQVFMVMSSKDVLSTFRFDTLLPRAFRLSLGS